MSWNVLADELAHTHRAELYPHTQPRHLEWPFRLAAVVRHVAELRPDVLCLQEVDDWAGLQRALSGLGYEGVHMQRTGGRGDGCATLWLRDRLCVATAAAAGQQQLLQPPPQQPRQLQPPLPQQQPQAASAASAAYGVVSGSGSGSGSGGGVYKIRMCDHDLRDNVALLVHLRPLTPREAQQQQARRQKQEQRQEPSRRRRQQQQQPDEQGGSSDMEISEGGSSSTSSGGEQGQAAAAAVAAAEARRAKRTRGSCEEEAGVLPRSAAEAAAAAAMSALRPYSANPGAVAAVAGVTAATHMGNGSRRAVVAAAAVSVALGGSLQQQQQQQQQQAAGRGSAAAQVRGAHAVHSSERGGDGGMDTSAGPADAGSNGRVLPEHINRGFLVANTHVLFNIKRGDIKLGQLRVILNELAAAAAAAAAGAAGAEAEATTAVPTESGGASGVHRTGADAGEEGEEGEEDEDGVGRRGGGSRLGSTAAHLPCVFAGDFNTAPGSGLYRYLRSGRLELAAEDRRELSGQVEGYGYASLQRDVLNGRRPRLERWAPPPQPPQQSPEQQQQQQDRQAERAGGQQGSDSDGDETSAIEQWRLQQQRQQQQQQRRGGYGGSGGGGLGGTAAGDYGGGDCGGRAAPLVRWDLEDLTYAMGQQAAMEAVAAGTAAVAARYGTDSSGGGGWMSGAGGGRHGWGRGGGGGGGRGRGRGGGQAVPPPGWWEAGGAAAAVVSHPLQLQSAYAAADAGGREPLFTTLHHRYVGTVDFVWFTPGAGPQQQQVLQARSQEQRQRAASRDRRQGRRQDQACGPHGEAIEAGAKQKQRRQRSRHRGGDLDAEDAAEVGQPRGDGWRLQPLRVLLPPDPLAFPYGMPCVTWPSDHVSLVVDFRLS